MLKVLIADDHVIVRNGLKQFLGALGGVVVAGEAVDGEAVLAALGTERFDLIMLDLTMPGLSGVPLIEQVRDRDAEVPILIYSMHRDLAIVKRTFLAGATGFVTKGGDEEILASAIHAVAAGRRFVDPTVVEPLLFDEPGDPTAAPHGRLSPRELQVMKLVAAGKSVKQIAQEIFISPKTVSSHKRRVIQKMEFGREAELVRYAIDYGLVE